MLFPQLPEQWHTADNIQHVIALSRRISQPAGFFRHSYPTENSHIVRREPPRLRIPLPTGGRQHRHAVDLMQESRFRADVPQDLADMVQNLSGRTACSSQFEPGLARVSA